MYLFSRRRPRPTYTSIESNEDGAKTFRHNWLLHPLTSFNNEISCGHVHLFFPSTLTHNNMISTHQQFLVFSGPKVQASVVGLACTYIFTVVNIYYLRNPKEKLSVVVFVLWLMRLALQGGRRRRKRKRLGWMNL